MRLNFEAFDGRSHNHKRVIDEDTGREIGYIKSHGVGFSNCGGIEVWLFDGKYSITMNRYEECRGFVKGVEAVLNHMTSIGNRSITKTEVEIA